MRVSVLSLFLSLGLVLNLSLPALGAAPASSVVIPPADVVVENFLSLTKIPRCSLKEDKVRAHIVDIAERQGLRWKKDKAGNLLVIKQATPGFEQAPTVVLQAHMDMVCLSGGRPFDFDKDPIKVVQKDGWMRAEGTTLGADDGMGMAMMLALLRSKDVKHGRLECLFTVNGEGGMSGAAQLQPDFFTGKLFINLDAEHFDQIITASAGSFVATARLPFQPEAAPADYNFYSVAVDGGLGGHSGLDIHLGRANVLRILADFLNHARSRYALRLASLEGGEADNSIPSGAIALVGVPKAAKEDFLHDFQNFVEARKVQFADSDPGLVFALIEAAAPAILPPKAQGDGILQIVQNLPCGVIDMSKATPGLVETSSNIGMLRTVSGYFTLTVHTRSSLSNALKRERAVMEALYTAHGMSMAPKDVMEFPAWESNPYSPLLKVVTAAFQTQLGVQAKSGPVHAGLECGYVARLDPVLDMVSIGALQVDVHTPRERVRLDTVAGIWKVLLETLHTLGKG